jgi:hypothetical protein
MQPEEDITMLRQAEISLAVLPFILIDRHNERYSLLTSCVNNYNKIIRDLLLHSITFVADLVL